MSLLIDCHTHTTRYSGCSSVSPEMLCSLGELRGLDGIVLTEHQVRWQHKELDGLRSQCPGITIYSGVEVSVGEGYDVVVIGPETGSMFGYAVPFELLLRELEPVRGETFLFVAHPFRYTDQMTIELEEILSAVDGIEVNSINILRNNARDEEGWITPVNQAVYDMARGKYGLVAVYNSDVHHESGVGALANRFRTDAPPADEKALARLLKTEAIEEHQDPALLRSLLGLGRKRGLFGW